MTRRLPCATSAAIDLLALRDGRREWLLAHHRLAGRDGREHVPGMRRARRCHQHGIDLVGRDELIAVVEDACATKRGGNLPGASLVHVRDPAHRRAADDIDELAAVILADEAGADDADADGHGVSDSWAVGVADNDVAPVKEGPALGPDRRC